MSVPLLELPGAAAAVATALLLGWTGLAKVAYASRAGAVHSGLTAVLGGPEHSVLVLRLVGIGELAVAALLLAFPPPVGGACTAVLGVLFLGYLVRVRRVAPGSSCGCAGATAAPVTWRSLTRAGGLLGCGLVAAAAGSPWWQTASREPVGVLGGAAVVTVGYVLCSAEADGWWLVPLRRLRLRLFPHPLAGTRGPVPVAASVELLESSLAWQATRGLVRSSLLEHWLADGYRMLRYAGRCTPGDRTHPVSVLFAVDATATTSAPGGWAVRLTVVDDETGAVLQDPPLTMPRIRPLPVVD